MMGKPARFAWPSRACRLLLEWAEENKGENGDSPRLLLNTKDNTIVRGLLDRCKPDEGLPAQEKRAFTGKNVAERIESKLKAIWNKYGLSKYGSEDFKKTFAV